MSLAGLDAVSLPSAGLKWPNDILIGARKVAGVLAEIDGPAVVVGIGINVGWAPPDLPATHLRAHREGAARDDVLHALLDALTGWLAAADADVVAAYHRNCLTIGRDVRVEMPDGAFEGVARAITTDGHLVVETETGPRSVPAGDVVHLR